MRFAEYSRRTPPAAIVSLALMALSGCGTPGAPQPPSLRLPEPVNDLTAARAGNSVTLTWTMPRKSTDHLPLKGQIPVSICWRDAREDKGDCQPSGQASEAPEAKVEFKAPLPGALSTGKPRPVSLFVELKSPKGRSAGLSNPAVILAGTAPGPVVGLTAQVRADGVALHWTASESGTQTTLVRLHRKLLTPPASAAKPANAPAEGKPGTVKPAAEPALRDLLVDPQSGGQGSGAIDKTARFGQVYEYTAQRLIRVSLSGAERNGDEIDLPGEISAPVRVATVDTFPPAVPQGLVAVYVPEEKTIDLSWEPNTEEDLAGYIVYRAGPESGAGWQRISGPQPLTGAAYRDASAEPGRSYRYAVSAIDQLGHESDRSAKAAESVPNP